MENEIELRLRQIIEKMLDITVEIELLYKIKDSYEVGTVIGSIPPLIHPRAAASNNEARRDLPRKSRRNLGALSPTYVPWICPHCGTRIQSSAPSAQKQHLSTCRVFNKKEPI